MFKTAGFLILQDGTPTDAISPIVQFCPSPKSVALRDKEKAKTLVHAISFVDKLILEFLLCKVTRYVKIFLPSLFLLQFGISTLFFLQQ